MPLAIAKPIRVEVVRRRLSGESLVNIAGELDLKYRTVRGLWQRYRKLGEQGLDNGYARCGRHGILFSQSVHETAFSLRRQHPLWGAQLICLKLEDIFPEESIPSERTVSRWLRDAGLQPLRGRRPKAPQPQRGSRPHEVWQIDAKECLRLADGQGCCEMSVVDEHSGAGLGLKPFPPLPLEPSLSTGSAAAHAGAI
jgi:hypothetical protein